MNSQDGPFAPDSSRKFLIAGVAGAVVLAATAVFAADRAWANLLLVSYYLITLGIGAALFLALTNVCGATWNAAFRRAPAAMTGLLPLAGVLMLATLGIGLSRYTWHHHGEGGAGTFWFKQLWLQPTFFAMRAVAIVLIWIVLSRLLANDSRAAHSATTRISVLFLAAFAVTVSCASVDWFMALEPMWFSTMWGVYHFSGLMEATLAATIVACIWLRRAGPLRGAFTDEHLHDLGKMLIGFSCFWMYIWFSQYMLIWYANIPEETSYFLPRLQGPWAPVVACGLVLNWGVPFFVLLPRPCKRNESVMLRVAVLVLAGRWVDLCIMTFPPVTGETPAFGLPEIASVLAIFGLSAWLFRRSFAATNPASPDDPDLAASLHYHV